MAVKLYESPPRRRVVWLVGGFAWAALFVVYALVLHPWLDDWGSTSAEREEAMPGDEIIGGGTRTTTRAVTIEAPAEEVWAWLIQHGQDRAGFYSYTWLENILGVDIHNASEVNPEWQTREVGDRVPMANDRVGGLIGEASKLTVVQVEPPAALVLADDADGTGTYLVRRIDDGTSRLIIRERVSSDGASVPGRLFGWLVWDPMHFVMQRQMMLGIQRRAEGDPAAPPAVAFVANLSWLVAGGSVAAAFVAWRRARPWAVLPVVVALPAATLGQDPQAALAAFVSCSVVVLGALYFGGKWLAIFPFVFAAVLLVLLLAPEAHVAFGMIFFVTALTALAVRLARPRDASTRPRRTGILGHT